MGERGLLGDSGIQLNEKLGPQEELESGGCVCVRMLASMCAQAHVCTCVL